MKMSKILLMIVFIFLCCGVDYASAKADKVAEKTEQKVAEKIENKMDGKGEIEENGGNKKMQKPLKKKAKKPKKKFHKPNTPAEKALDRILRINEGREREHTEKREDMFTQVFIDEYDRVKKIAEESDDCIKLGMDCSPWSGNVDPIPCSQDSPYGYDKHPYNRLFRESNCSQSSKGECDIVFIDGTYHMKKQDGKWKIDGICCYHDHNYKDYTRCSPSINFNP